MKLANFLKNNFHTVKMQMKLRDSFVVSVDENEVLDKKGGFLIKRNAQLLKQLCNAA